MYLVGIEMIHLMCMCVTKRKNKQTMQCILHRETIPFHASFTLLLVFIPPSISQTWLKCSSYQRLCWTTGREKKKQWDGEKNEAEKSKASFTAWRFSSFTGGKKKRTQTFKLFFLPLSPALFLSPYSPQLLKPPRYLSTTPLQRKLNSLRRTNISVTLFFPHSIDIIPSALFSPITLCHVTIWMIRAVQWLGQREECWGWKVAELHMLSGDKCDNWRCF